MEFHHISVLLPEMIESVLTDRNGIYVDCTLGGEDTLWQWQNT